MKKHSTSPRLSPSAPLWIKSAALLLVCALLLSGSALPVRADASSEETISVGLYFVNNALPSANLQNVSGYGSGYALGIYEPDANGDREVFHPLAQIEQTEISMLMDTTMYLSGNEYVTTPLQGVTVGSYHLELVYPYSSYAEAQQVAALHADGFVAYSYGQFYVRIGSYATYAEALAQSGYYADCTVTGESDYGITVVETTSGKILFELDEGEGTTLGVLPQGSAETRTWFKGTQYNGGFRYDRPEGQEMHVANILSMEQYVASVLCREFGVVWPDEALKAAACCIRTFAVTGGQHTTFDVCNDTCCQVYGGVFLSPQWTHIRELCAQTAGEYICYQSEPILAVYHSSNGGATVDCADAWSVDYPYLQGIYDPFESTVDTGAEEWSVSFSLQELTELAQLWGFDCSAITDVYVSEWTELGNVAAVTFVDVSGETHVFTDDDTILLGDEFYSRRYVIIPPWGTATVTEITMGAAGASSALTAGPFAVYDGSTTTTVDDVAVMTAEGLTTVSGSAAILDGSGTAQSGAYPSAQTGTKTVTNNSGDYLVVGSGWGHNVGLSAYGTYAMAELGYSYQQILQFYFQGVTIQQLTK